MQNAYENIMEDFVKEFPEIVNIPAIDEESSEVVNISAIDEEFFEVVNILAIDEEFLKSKIHQ